MFKITIEDLKEEAKSHLDMADAYDMAMDTRVIWALIDVIQKLDESIVEISDKTPLFFKADLKDEKSWGRDWVLLQNSLPDIIDTAIEAKKYDKKEVSFYDLCQSASDKMAMFVGIENNPNSKVKVNPNTAFGVGSVIGLARKYKGKFPGDFKINFDENVQDTEHGDYNWFYIGENLDIKLQQVMEEIKSNKSKENLKILQKREKPTALKRRPRL